MDSIFRWYNDNDAKLNVQKSGETVYLTSPLFDDIPWLNHGFSTRLGGVSSGVCSSMNFAYNDFDSTENVSKNHNIFCSATGIDINKIVKTKQVHDNKVIKIDESHIFRNATEPGCDYPGYDGMITNLKGTTLFAFSADCALITIVDPVNKAIGSCHSGWRGTAKRISKVTIDMMKENYGSNPDDLLVTVWPSICPECFEVEFDMISEARASFNPSDWNDIYYQKDDIKYQFNLWEANKKVLQESNIPAAHIFMPNLCTKCNPSTLFSHRNMGLKRGTLISYISIK